MITAQNIFTGRRISFLLNKVTSTIIMVTTHMITSARYPLSRAVKKSRSVFFLIYRHDFYAIK